MPPDQPHPVDPAHHVLRSPPGRLDVFFRPTAVAVIGASETPGSVGRTLVVNLLATPFGGQVFPINPKRESVLGQKCYPRLSDAPAAVDLAIVAVPAPLVPGVIDECLTAGVRGVVIISAGFKEAGPEGAALEREIRARVAGTALRVIGPNCLGVMSPTTGLNATFAAAMARPGHLAFVSQSGALLTAILDWSLAQHVGFSHVISTGSMLDVGWGDLIDYLGDDPQTKNILIYMESIGDARHFLSAAREVALQKPIVVIETGRTAPAARAAASHTGAMVGSDEALDAAFRRAGVLRVDDISELFSLADVLSKQPLPLGPKLAIVTNAGGPGVLATDALVELGGQLATLSDATLAALSRVLPAHWSHANPVDVLGDADPQRFADSVETVAQDPQCDGVLAVLTPQAMTDPTATAERLAQLAAHLAKPLLACWMGGQSVAAGIQILNRGRIPTLAYPDSAARAFHDMWRHSENLRTLFETPVSKPSEGAGAGRDGAGAIVLGVLNAGRTLLTEPEAKQVLAGYAIPTVETRIASTSDEAVGQAQGLGYPVAVKLLSTSVTHKTDVGGVCLDVADDNGVRRAFVGIRAAVEQNVGPGHFAGVTVQPMVRRTGYELILGSSVDAQLGPVILFGCGGQLVEIFRDKSLGLPPLTSTLARRIMERTRIYAALQGFRGRRSVDMVALEELLVRFAQLVVENPRICEIEINPLLADEDGFLALDARVILHPLSRTDAELPRPVIRLYPQQYESQCATRDGRTLRIRPIRPEDEPLMVRFHETLSAETVYARYAQVLSLDRRTVHDRLARLCFIDYDRQMALVAVDDSPPGPRIVAVARLIRLHGTNEAEFALVVSDAYQKLGLGSQLMGRLVAVAHIEGWTRVIGYISATNRGMLAICRELGFQFTVDGATRVATLDLGSNSPGHDAALHR